VCSQVELNLLKKAAKYEDGKGYFDRLYSLTGEHIQKLLPRMVEKFNAINFYFQKNLQ
jgi:hypothetical protein